MRDGPEHLDGAAALAEAKALYSRLTPENTLTARRMLRSALEEGIGWTPGSQAEAWAFLADILTCDYLNRWNGAEAAELAEAETAAGEALRLDPNLAHAHYAQAFICRAKGDHEAALAAYQRTIELSPDMVRAYAQKANELMYLGRLDEVPPLVETAIGRTPPGNLQLGMFYWIIGRARFLQDRYGEAVDWLRQSVEVRPNLWYNRLYLVSAHALNGDRSGAEGVLREFDAVFPGYTLARVKQNEQHNPNDNPVMVRCRAKFYRGLLMAGMKEG